MRFTVGVAQNFFFDRPAVTDATDRAKRKNLSKFGAFTRRNARDLLKYADRPSAPGEPPAAHKTATITKRGKNGAAKVQSASPLKEFLYFAFDASSESVVIGPAKLNRPGDAPAALEYGGSSVVIDSTGKTVSITVRARPFMGPSFDKAKRDLPQIWRDSISR